MIIKVSLPSPTPGGAPVTGREIKVSLKSLASKIDVDLLDRRITNFRIDGKKREIQIIFAEVEEGESSVEESKTA